MIARRICANWSPLIHRFSPVLEDAYVPTPDAIAGAIRATTGSPAPA